VLTVFTGDGALARTAAVTAVRHLPSIWLPGTTDTAPDSGGFVEPRSSSSIVPGRSPGRLVIVVSAGTVGEHIQPTLSNEEPRMAVPQPKTREDIIERLAPLVPGTVTTQQVGLAEWVVASWSDGPIVSQVVAAVTRTDPEKIPPLTWQHSGGRWLRYQSFQRGNLVLGCHRRVSAGARALSALAVFAASGCWHCGYRSKSVAATEELHYSFDLVDPDRPETHDRLAPLLDVGGPGTDQTLRQAAEYLAALTDISPVGDRPDRDLAPLAQKLCALGHLSGLLTLSAALA
jgi:hypothetical protein